MQGYVHGLCRGGEVSFGFGFLNFEKAGLSCLEGSVSPHSQHVTQTEGGHAESQIMNTCRLLLSTEQI